MRRRFLRAVLGVRVVGSKIPYRGFGLQKLRRDVSGHLKIRLTPSVRREQAGLEFLLEVLCVLSQSAQNGCLARANGDGGWRLPLSSRIGEDQPGDFVE